MILMSTKTFVSESFSNENIVDRLYVYMVMENFNAQNVNERIISVFKERYSKIRGLMNNMSQFVLVTWKIFNET